MGIKKVTKNALENAFPELADLPYEYKLSNAGKGTILGEEDLILERTSYSCSCFCDSDNGSLFKVPKAALLTFREAGATWKKLNREVKKKEIKKKAFHIKTKPLNLVAVDKKYMTELREQSQANDSVIGHSLGEDSLFRSS